jgi:putative ABC transport system permease protein
LLAGRFFEEADASPEAKTILVNQELARLAWPGQNPLGKRIAHAQTDNWLEVVGVVGNIIDWQLDAPPAPIFCEPYQRNLLYSQGPHFMVRSTRDPALLTKPLRDLAREMAPGAMAPSIYFVERELYRSTQLRRTYMWFLNLFGLIGLTLSGIGLYGVLSYSVVQRTREIGVRMALGANTRDVLTLVLGQGGRLMLVGVAVGACGAFGLTHLLRSLLFGTSATDPLVFVCALMVLLLVALMACYLPARRASQVDPAVTLRHE